MKADVVPRMIVGAIVLVALYMAIHAFAALASKSSPPVTCQVFGGHWDIWNGWHCG